LLSNLKTSKINNIDQNKTNLMELLTEEIVKRYAYREGLYEYYKIHDAKIKKATEILGNPSTYLGYLR
nr:peptidase S41 [Mariniflexile sp.]